ncbi:MAG: hypothetical protein ACOCY6_03530, partial [Halodesulfurarchaeum sp.]
MNEESVVVTDGVTVSKSFDRDGFPVPAVTFDVASTREEPVEITITDDIPEGFGIEQIGFHPEYESDHWRATGDGGVRFERTIEPGEELYTLYGVRMAEETEPTVFLEKPTVEVRGGGDAEEVVPRGSSEVVRELARGERDTVPGLEEPEPLVEAPEDERAEEPAEAELSEADLATDETGLVDDGAETASTDTEEVTAEEALLGPDADSSVEELEEELLEESATDPLATAADTSRAMDSSDSKSEGQASEDERSSASDTERSSASDT